MGQDLKVEGVYRFDFSEGSGKSNLRRYAKVDWKNLKNMQRERRQSRDHVGLHLCGAQNQQIHREGGLAVVRLREEGAGTYC